MAKDFNTNKRAYLLYSEKKLPESTKEKIRYRRRRTTLQSLSGVIAPLKGLGFAVIIFVLSYIALTQLRHLFFHTSYFELKSIRVEGISRLQRDEIMRFSGVSPGQNVLLLDTDAVKDRLNEHPVVKAADVQFSGLNTLILEIVERKPFMYAQVGLTFYEIDEYGVIIDTDSLGNLDLPMITGLKLQANVRGDDISGYDGFYMAKQWIENLDKKILSDISEINFSSKQSPYIFLVGGEKIFPVDLNDFKNRYNFLRALLDNLRDNNVEPIYLDMRAPSESTVVVRKKKDNNNLKGGRNSVVDG